MSHLRTWAKLDRPYYTLVCTDRDVLVSRGMLIRLCQEGHIFKMLLFGREGFREELQVEDEGRIELPTRYHIQGHVIAALLMSLRINEPALAYKHRHLLEAVGGFKFLDRYVKERKTRLRRSIELTEKCENNNPPSFSQPPIVIDLVDDQLEEATE